MKKIQLFIITLVTLSSFNMTAQNDNTKSADKHFEKLEFVEAAKAYTKLVEKGEADAYVYERLAEANYNTFNTVEAEKWFAKALETNANADMLFKYSEMLKANGKYDASNAEMATFTSTYPTDGRAIAFKANPNYLDDILKSEEKFTVENLDFNTPASDFGGTLKDGKLYFTSARNDSRRTYGWNDQPYLDVYELAVTEDGSLSEANLINGKINTKYHEGIVSITPDGNTMYFSRESFFENMYEKSESGNVKISVLQLFKATKNEGTWGDIEALNINTNTYSVKNPSVSKDGSTLYFASDMPGGFGLYDIYKASIESNGMLGTPENLGTKINTSGQEMFPFAGDDAYLYFSSNGHLGLGNLDVFYAEYSGGRILKNIGAPINSKADDFAFAIYEDKKGYVSSNRAGGKGSDDIYAIKEIKPLCDVNMIVSVENEETGEKVGNASVTLYDVKGSVLATQATNADGIVTFKTDCGIETSLKVTKEEFEDKAVTVNATQEESKAVSVNLTPIKKIIVADKVVLDPIYFEFNKSDITEQGASELDRLVSVMTKYPEMVIYATSHTDSRGKADYNMSLSDKRAKSTVAYVVSKGIAVSRITGEGKGETVPLSDCGASCTEEQYQLNRRSEFTIVSGGPGN
ncbi:OmpA family protein [Psychroserpens sp. NJDZ02]|uniref:OmpA family protein n=1 Tax=Psychroserpens sp. NJDZ02 TaxID=2570561 RepID=UPI0010A85D32|nr:OmpA family protein [Psychroserpens sp. NJDZ02]QCE40910.1 cell envelope biogenesis protein OmpA [Psychroserpens sp. NJDZ02]